MYSANGRQKQTRETAANTALPTLRVLICSDCGYEQEGTKKVFGEINKCLKCGSEKTTLLNRVK
jgi:predicted Zn-ribbon and HTH transcriptional regulator